MELYLYKLLDMKDLRFVKFFLKCLLIIYRDLIFVVSIMIWNIIL